MTAASPGTTALLPAHLHDDPWIRWVLDTARTELQMTIAYIAEFDADTQVIRAAGGDLDAIRLPVGTAVPAEATFCVRVLSGQLPPVVKAAGRDARTRDLPTTARLGIGSYVGAPIRSARDGRAVGMLCCLGQDEGAHLGPGSARLLEFLASLIGERLAMPSDSGGEDAAAATARIAGLLRDEEIVPVFQPVVDLHSGTTIAYEALTRFAGADTEAVFRDAARTGLGVQLEAAAVRAALAAACRRPLDVAIGLNLSPAALVIPEILDLLLAPRDVRIGVEVTEHAPVRDYGPLLAARCRLREAGIPVSIDDAGSGYASMRHVLRVMPDVVKLDASIVSDIDRDPAKQALALGMRTFADGIGAALVAEGVETEAERAALAERGIGFGQGWLWGRPAPFD